MPSVQAPLSFRSPEAPGRTISPLLEMGAYELLWSEKGMFFARMADLFREHPEALPSELVAEDPAKEMAQMVVEILREKGVSGFGVRVHRAGGYPEGILGIDGAASEGGAARGPGRDQEGRE